MCTFGDGTSPIAIDPKMCVPFHSFVLFDFNQVHLDPEQFLWLLLFFVCVFAFYFVSSGVHFLGGHLHVSH